MDCGANNGSLIFPPDTAFDIIPSNTLSTVNRVHAVDPCEKLNHRNSIASVDSVNDVNCTIKRRKVCEVQDDMAHSHHSQRDNRENTRITSVTTNDVGGGNAASTGDSSTQVVCGPVHPTPHQLLSLNMTKEDNNRNMISAEDWVMSLTAGSVVIFSSTTLHCSGPNTTLSPRDVFYSQYSTGVISAPYTKAGSNQYPLCYGIPTNSNSA